MDDPQGAESVPGASSPAIGQPQAPSLPTAADRKGIAFGGGLLAGLGLSIAVVLVMHVVQAATNTSGLNLDPYVLLALFVAGPTFGVGVGMALAALVPPDSTDSRVVPAGTGDPG